MTTLRNIPIRYKLVLMQVFTSVLVICVFFAIFIVTDVNSYKSRKVASVEALAQVLGSNSVAAIRFQDSDAAHEMLGELEKVAPDILHAAIVDSNGRIFASYSKKGEAPFTIPPKLYTSRTLFSNDRLFVRNEIQDGAEHFGRIYIETDLMELQQIKRSRYELAIFLTLAAVGFSFLVALALQSYISTRLLRLVGIMNEVSATGNYDMAIPEDGNDEIGTLTNVFNHMMQQIHLNQQRKDEFIGVASHELKTPLTSVKGYMELLKSIEDRQPNKQLVQKGLENVEKLERLIQDLLDVSRIQSGQLQLNNMEFSVDELIDETVANFGLITGSHTIAKESAPVHELVFGDRQRIEQVLINLISNAIKYSPGGNKVIVRCERKPDELVVTVRDFGVGIPKEEQGKIFERFYRTKNTNRHISGFGLGLYISRDIIRRHRGNIWVESYPDGTAFYFSIPLARTVKQGTPGKLVRDEENTGG